MKKTGNWIVLLALVATCFSGCGRETPEEPASAQADAPVSVSEPEVPREELSQESPSAGVEASESENGEPAAEPPAESSENEAPSAAAPSLGHVKPANRIVPPIETIDSFYARNPSAYLYVGGWYDFAEDYSENAHWPYGQHVQAILEGFALLNSLEPAADGYSITDTEFLLWTTDGVRHVYGVNEEGYLIADGDAYVLPAEKMQAIKTLHSRMTEPDKVEQSIAYAYPQWLKWMTPGNIREIVFHSPARGPLTIHPNLKEYAAFIATVPVRATGYSTYALGSVDLSGDDVFHLELRFDSGVVYNLYAMNVLEYAGDLYVESSDVSYGCKYRMLSEGINGAATHMIEEYEHIADAKTMDDVMNHNA